MKRILSLSFLSLAGMVAMSIVPTAIVSALWILADVGAYRRESTALRSEYIEERREMLKREVDEAIQYVEYSKSLTESRLMESIRSRTYEAHSIATGILGSAGLTRSREETAGLILAALRPIRFDNGKGYYFVFDLRGVQLLSADKPELEGQSLLDTKDTQGRYVIRDMIEIAKNTGEGFTRYTWTKPSTPGEGFPKISFIKLFEPLGWFIGTGEYLDDVERDIQQEVLERLSRITYGHEGHILVGGLDGAGEEAVTPLIAKASSGGGYVHSVVPKTGGEGPAPKLSYAAPIEDWQWYVAAGVFIDDIDAVVKGRAAELDRRIRTHVAQVAALLGVMLALILIPGRLILRDIGRSFDEFGAFFQQAAAGAASIDPARFRFRELYDLAESANAMNERRRAAESALRESEERYRTLLAASFEGVVMSREARIVDVTPQLVAMMGYDPDEVLGREVIDFVHSSDRKAMAETIGRRGEEPNQYRLVRKDGSVMEVESRSRYFLYKGREVRVTAIRDITERKLAEQAMLRLQAQLVQSQKMEAIGKLAGGVAHDFNNILTSIMGYSDLIRSQPGLAEGVGEGIEEIHKAAERAASLTQQLLAFSRKQLLQPRVLDLNVLVLDLSKMLKRLVGEDVLFVSVLDADPARVRADPTQVEQVIVNLTVNARDAMPKGGTITVETRNATLDGHGLAGSPDLKGGEYVLLSVSDTGTGMDDDVKSHLFEPFFTTKEMGRGTGLGLSTVYGIVTQSGGQIGVESEPGRGTSICVYLPPASEVPEEEAEAARRPEPTGGKETVLLVEDEEQLLVLTATILERYGYRVVKAGDPSDALKHLRRTDCPEPDLLITDVVMPGMSGRELADAAHRLRPQLKVLFVSGYTDDAILHHGALDPEADFLQKPFSPSALALKIREVLDG